MDGYDITGYINNNKKLKFTAGIRSTENYQFDGDLIYTDELDNLFIKNQKTLTQIEKEKK
ncbi:hypothetical protein SEVCU012_2257 [Staphylococcus pettenkoferi VCU012]|nr:hypothetical protein SEVCU012_2257 [Staphylococcus pettenkoferi VCU012]